jgi:transcription elongation GreA/GreB family factor
MDKHQVIDLCRDKIKHQLNQIQQQLASIHEARAQETKSSAGDKYETGREMLQSEEDRIQNQHDLHQMLLKELDATSKLSSNGHIQKGSLVQTQDHWYYLSVPMGKLSLDQGDCYAISMSSPLGKELLGKTKGDRFTFRGREMEVTNLL